MTIDRDTQFSDLNSNSSFYDWFTKENQEIIAKLNQINTFTVEGVNGITAPININGKASIGLSGKVDIGISFNGPAYFNAFAAIPNIAMRVNEINSVVGGFTFGTPVRVYYDTATSSIKYEAARGNDPDQAEVLGVVSEINATHSYVTMLGKIDGDFSAVNARGIGLTAGWIYFLDPGVTGDITDIEPVATGNVSKPVIMGITGNSGMVLQMRGNLIADNVLSSYSQISSFSTHSSVLDPEVTITQFAIGSIVSIRTMVNADFSPFTNAINSGDSVRLVNPSTSEKTVLYSSITNRSDPTILNTVENDILGVVVSKAIAGSSVVFNVLTFGYTDVFSAEPSNGLFYLNPAYTGTPLAIPTEPQYGNQYCSSGAFIFNKFPSFSLFNPHTVTPCTSPLRSSSLSESNTTTSTYNYLINGNFEVWQRDTGKNIQNSSTGSVLFADLWRRHDGVTGADNTKNYYLIRKEFDTYQTEIEGNPRYYLETKALGLCANGVTSGGYTGYDHLMIGHIVPGAKKFDSNTLNVNFYAKSSSTGYDIDVYLSRYTGSVLLDYTKLGTANLSTSWNKYSIGSYIEPLENTGEYLDLESDYCEIGVDFIPLIERANLNGVTLGDDLYVSLASFSASINSTSTSVYQEYTEQLKYCQQFYYTNYDIGDSVGSITLVDATTPSQSTEEIFILPNKSCYMIKWPNRMRISPTITFYSPLTGMSGRVYNKTSGFDTINSSGINGRDGSNASISGTTTKYGVNVCLYNGFINYDSLYFNIIANSDFPL